MHDNSAQLHRHDYEAALHVCVQAGAQLVWCNDFNPSNSAALVANVCGAASGAGPQGEGHQRGGKEGERWGLGNGMRGCVGLCEGHGRRCQEKMGGSRGGWGRHEQERGLCFGSKRWACGTGVGLGELRGVSEMRSSLDPSPVPGPLPCCLHVQRGYQGLPPMPPPSQVPRHPLPPP